MKSSPSPDPEESGAKDELLYRCGHHWSWVVYKDVAYLMHLHVRASTEQSICGTFPCILLLCLFSGAYTFHWAPTHTGQRWSVPTISQLSWPLLSLLATSQPSCHLSAFLATSQPSWPPLSLLAFGHLSLRVQLLWQSGLKLNKFDHQAGIRNRVQSNCKDRKGPVSFGTHRHSPGLLHSRWQN